MKTHQIRRARWFAVLLAAGIMLGGSTAKAEIPFTPYGMDAVPGAVFYTGVWDFYGTDPTPRSNTSDMGFRDVYGLDAIPEAFVPALRDMRHTLPHQTLQVLTDAIEESHLGDPAPQAPAGAHPVPRTKRAR